VAPAAKRKASGPTASATFRSPSASASLGVSAEEGCVVHLERDPQSLIPMFLPLARAKYGKSDCPTRATSHQSIQGRLATPDMPEDRVSPRCIQV